jgi:hypothetical protein
MTLRASLVALGQLALLVAFVTRPTGVQVVGVRGGAGAGGGEAGLGLPACLEQGCRVALRS